MYINNDLFTEMKKSQEKSLYAFNKMIDFVDKTVTTENLPNDEFSIVTSFFLSKFYKSLLSIRILSTAGFEEDSRSLLRILLEQLFSLYYISKDPTSRVKQFIEYNKIERMNFLDNIEKHYPSTFNNIDSELKAEIINDFKLVEKKYNRYRGWSGKTLREIAKEIGDSAIFWYDIIYSAESIHIHSSVNSSKNFLFEDNGITNVKIGPYPFDATDLYSKTIELTHDMLIQAMNNWNIDTKEAYIVWNECKALLQNEFLEKDK